MKTQSLDELQASHQHGSNVLAVRTQRKELLENPGQLAGAATLRCIEEIDERKCGLVLIVLVQESAQRILDTPCLEPLVTRPSCESKTRYNYGLLRERIK